MGKVWVNDGKAIRLMNIATPMVAGNVFLMGKLPLVADVTVTQAMIDNATATGEAIEAVGHRVGNWEFKAGVALVQGDEAYYDPTNHVIKKTSSTGLYHIGTVTRGAGANGICHVVLEGVATTVA